MRPFDAANGDLCENALCARLSEFSYGAGPPTIDALAVLRIAAIEGRFRTRFWDGAIGQSRHVACFVDSHSERMDA
jgi:hypothetical protein